MYSRHALLSLQFCRLVCQLNGYNDGIVMARALLLLNCSLQPYGDLIRVKATSAVADGLYNLIAGIVLEL